MPRTAAYDEPWSAPIVAPRPPPRVEPDQRPTGRPQVAVPHQPLHDSAAVGCPDLGLVAQARDVAEAGPGLEDARLGSQLRAVERALGGGDDHQPGRERVD